MSGIWNPYAFSPTGGAMPVGVPPALRVVGAQATAVQLTAAQAVFANFCMHSRLSVVPNATEQGRLPDGTPYKIVSLGAQQTVMMIWPAQITDITVKPGIGVAVPGATWILSPYGDPARPDQQRWRALSVPTLNGGVGTTYRAVDGRYFVEGGGGTSSGNKRLAPPLFSMAANIYLRPQRELAGIYVSDPIIFDSSLEQLSIDGNALKANSWRLSKDGLETSTSGTSGTWGATYQLPSLTEGDRWGLLTANSDKKKFVACRIASDMESWSFKTDNVRQSVVAWRAKNPAGLDDVAVKNHPTTVARKYPEGAPKLSHWTQGYENNNTTIYTTYSNPGAFIPNAPATITIDGLDSTRLVTYAEECDYSGTATFRRYVDFTGEIREDVITYEDKSDISAGSKTGWYGFNKTLYQDAVRFENSSVRANTTRAATLTMFGIPPIRVYEFSLDFGYSFDGDGRWETKFARYSYGATGEINGFIYEGSASAAQLASSAATIQYALERVLVHDSQFGVAAAVRVSAKTTTDAAQGYARVSAASGSADYDNVYMLAANFGTGKFPPSSYINRSSQTDELSIEMIFYGPSSKEAMKMDVPPPILAALRSAMGGLRAELTSIPARGGADPDVTSGKRQNAYLREKDVHAVLEQVLDFATDVSYAKDPKTGAGFFSCSWDDRASPKVWRNKVTGPWGWAPASSRTPLADDAKVLSNTSV